MIAFDRLVMLALGELSEPEASEVDEHVLSCGPCAAILEQLMLLQPAVRELVRAGRIAFPVTASLAQALRDAGLVSRSYRLAPERPVPCSVAAADIYALTTLDVDLLGVERVDLVMTLPLGSLRLEDVPFDRTGGAIRFVTASEQLRRLPTTRVTVEAFATDAAGERSLGRYHLDHTAFRPE
jgi:hypothetical protein